MSGLGSISGSSCESVRPELPAYLDGELPAGEAKTVAGHLHVCTPCNKYAGRLRRSWDALGMLCRPAGKSGTLSMSAPPMSRSVVGSVMARIGKEPARLSAGSGAFQSADVSSPAAGSPVLRLTVGAPVGGSRESVTTGLADLVEAGGTVRAVPVLTLSRPSDSASDAVPALASDRRRRVSPVWAALAACVSGAVLLAVWFASGGGQAPVAPTGPGSVVIDDDGGTPSGEAGSLATVKSAVPAVTPLPAEMVLPQQIRDLDTLRERFTPRQAFFTYESLEPDPILDMAVAVDTNMEMKMRMMEGMVGVDRAPTEVNQN